MDLDIPCGWNILEWQVSGTSPVAPWNCLGKTPGQSFQTLRWQQNPSHPPRLRLAEHDRCVRMIIATPLGQAKPTYHYIPLVSVVSSGLLWFIKLCSKTLNIQLQSHCYLASVVVVLLLVWSL